MIYEDIIDQVNTRFTAIQAGKLWDGTVSSAGYNTTVKSVDYKITSDPIGKKSKFEANDYAPASFTGRQKLEDVYPKIQFELIGDSDEDEANDSVKGVAKIVATGYIIDDKEVDSITNGKKIARFAFDMRRALYDIMLAEEAGSFTSINFNVLRNVSMEIFTEENVNGVFITAEIDYSFDI